MVEITIADKQGDPRRVVEIAKDEKQMAEAESVRENDAYLDFDEVWCVFDRDDHERFHDAVSMARSNGFELVISNPCVELWLLLHFRDSPGAQQRRALCRMLRKHLPGYDKRLAFEDLASGVGSATDRARRLDEDANRMGEPGRNPTTGFYRLVFSISREVGT
jgi:hypothetical protein